MAAPPAKRLRLSDCEEDLPLASDGASSFSSGIPFVLLTRKLTPWQWDRIEKLVHVGFDAHVVQDSPIDEPLIEDESLSSSDSAHPSSDSVLGKRGRPAAERHNAAEDPTIAATRAALRAGRLHHVSDEALRAAGYHDINTRAVRKNITAWERAVYWAADRYASAAPAGSAAARAGLRVTRASAPAAAGSSGLPRGVLGGCGRDALAELQARSAMAAAASKESTSSPAAAAPAPAASAAATTSSSPSGTAAVPAGGAAAAHPAATTAATAAAAASAPAPVPDAASEPRVFFAEDDAQWTDALSLHALCSAILAERPAPHLVAEKIAWTPAEDPGWPSWGQGFRYFKQQHLAAAFVPFCCLSSRLLRDIRAFAAEHNTLIYLEILFVSLAKRGGLPVRFYTGAPRPLPVASRWRPDFTDADISAALAGHRCPQLLSGGSRDAPGSSSRSDESRGATGSCRSSDGDRDGARSSSSGSGSSSSSGPEGSSAGGCSSSRGSGAVAEADTAAMSASRSLAKAAGSAPAPPSAAADGSAGEPPSAAAAAVDASAVEPPSAAADASAVEPPSAAADGSASKVVAPASSKAAARAEETSLPPLPAYTVLFHPIKREPAIWVEWEAGRPLLLTVATASSAAVSAASAAAGAPSASNVSGAAGGAGFGAGGPAAPPAVSISALVGRLSAPPAAPAQAGPAAAPRRSVPAAMERFLSAAGYGDDI